MSRILVIESSARQQGSVSRQLTADFIAQWQAAHPQDEVTVRDLAKQPVPHLDETLLAGWMKPAEQQNDAEKAAAAARGKAWAPTTAPRRRRPSGGGDGDETRHAGSELSEWTELGFNHSESGRATSRALE